MTVNLKNFLNPKVKMSKMGEFQELQKIEEELQMLETKEESPYYCDECEMDPHHIIQYSLF